MNTLGLLLGLFATPLAMLAICHRFRALTPLQRRVFWGLASGYALAVAVVLAALMVPPVQWGPEQPLRTATVHWGLFLLPALGALAALLSIRAGRD